MRFIRLARLTDIKCMPKLIYGVCIKAIKIVRNTAALLLIASAAHVFSQSKPTSDQMQEFRSRQKAGYVAQRDTLLLAKVEEKVLKEMVKQKIRAIAVPDSASLISGVYLFSIPSPISASKISASNILEVTERIKADLKGALLDYNKINNKSTSIDLDFDRYLGWPDIMILFQDNVLSWKPITGITA